MKLQLVTLVVLALVVCATVPMTAVAASSKATALTIKAPATAYTSGFEITGKLTGGSPGAPLSEKLITVYQSTNGKTWTTTGTGWTDSGGYYTVAVSKPVTGYYKATFAGDKTYRQVTSQTITLTLVAPTAPTAWFGVDTQTGIAPLTVTFKDQSTGTGPLTYKWDVNNDGNVESTQQNPSFTYTASGTYTVKLTVTGPGGSDDEVKTNYVTVAAPPVAPVAMFSADPSTGTAPLTVQFTDQSTGIVTSWKWDLNNDGITDSTEQNPTYTYTAAGAYPVKLTVAGPGGSNELIRSDAVVVSPPVAPTAAFRADVRTGALPLKVQFTDQSIGTGPFSYAWDFGNGDTSFAQNPLYTYTAAGTYTVSLKVTGPGGTDTEVKTDYITVSKVQPVLSLQYTPQSPQVGDDVLVKAWLKAPSGSSVGGDDKVVNLEVTYPDGAKESKPMVWSGSDGCYKFTVHAANFGNYAIVAKFAGNDQSASAVSQTVPFDCYTRIGAFNLQNQGGFVARISCEYSEDGGVTWHRSGTSGDIILGHTGTALLSELGVPNNALVKIHADVALGTDNVGSEVFRFSSDNTLAAEYLISGTTLDNRLTFVIVW